MWPVRAGCCMSPAEDALLLLAIVRRDGWASDPAVPGPRVCLQVRAAFGSVTLGGAIGLRHRAIFPVLCDGLYPSTWCRRCCVFASRQGVMKNQRY